MELGGGRLGEERETTLFHSHVTAREPCEREVVSGVGGGGRMPPEGYCGAGRWRVRGGVGKGGR